MSFRSQVLRLERHGADADGAEGTVALAEVPLAGQTVRFFDGPVHHGFTFTPSFSLFIVVDTEGELDRIVDALATGGNFLMPSGDYGFSRRFAWLNDEFGVSWQINLERWRQR